MARAWTCHWRYELQGGSLRQQVARRGRNAGASFATSARRLPGNSATTCASGSDAQIRARFCGPAAAALIRQRMADKLAPHALLVVELLFKRQQAQHQIHRLMHVRTRPGRQAHTCGLTY